MMRSRIASVALASAVVIVGFAAYRAADAGTVIDAGTVHGEALYAYDVTDARQIVGFADNVFVGRVVERAGTAQSDGGGSGVPMPRTVFSVEVQRNIKGDLGGTVAVAQDGGRVEYLADRDYPEAGVEKGDRVSQLVLVNEDPLLKEGEPYLFATRRSDGPGEHHITAAGFANERLDGAAERERMTSIAEKAEARQIDPTELDPSESPVESGG